MTAPTPTVEVIDPATALLDAVLRLTDVLDAETMTTVSMGMLAAWVGDGAGLRYRLKAIRILPRVSRQHPDHTEDMATVWAALTPDLGPDRRTALWLRMGGAA